MLKGYITLRDVLAVGFMVSKSTGKRDFFNIPRIAKKNL
jgi:hypothetical protein